MIITNEQEQEILGGFYGAINQTKDTPLGLLVESHVAGDGGGEWWELGQWHLIAGGCVSHVCDCNGYDGVSQVHDVTIYNQLNEHDDGLIESYEVRGLAEQAMRELLPRAEEGDEDVSVLITEHYNGPGERIDFERGEGGEVTIFEDYNSAARWIAAQEEGVYQLAHNESSRRDYLIVNA